VDFTQNNFFCIRKIKNKNKKGRGDGLFLNTCASIIT
jgi:hypothetical protein